MSHNKSCNLFTPLWFAMESELGAGFTKGLNLSLFLDLDQSSIQDFSLMQLRIFTNMYL